MARTRDTVTESLGVLKELEERHAGTHGERQARMLRLAKERPTASLGEISAEIGCSERSAQRWWESYRTGGIEKLFRIGARKRGKPRRIDDSTLQELQTKLEQEGFAQLEEIQEWLQTSHGISYSRSGIWNLLRQTVQARPRGWHTFIDSGKTANIEEPGTSLPQSTGVSNQVIHFLNALPTSSDGREWILRFREAISSLLGDVDRVTVNVNLDCHLTNPEAYSLIATIRQNVSDNETGDASVQISRADASPAERLIDYARQQGFPMAEYHSPLALDYYYEGTAYLGTILLWRQTVKPPISDPSRHLINALQPFIIFALSDLVARHQANQPIDRVFHDALTFLVEEAKLSPQEERVVILQLMGHSYKEMADVLDVTVDTVKKHFKQIHRKTGTRGQAELFAKYFTSRLIPDSLRDYESGSR